MSYDGYITNLFGYSNVRIMEKRRDVKMTTINPRLNMDRIKYRAWNPKTNTMHEVRQIDWDNHDSYEICLSCDSRYYGRSELILMQCTGLRDSEGVLIWEGDVVEIKLDDYRHQKPNLAYDDVITPVITNICEVRYRLSRGFIALVRNKPYKGNVLKLKNEHDTVIGNIYESPHLTAPQEEK